MCESENIRWMKSVHTVRIHVLILNTLSERDRESVCESENIRWMKSVHTVRIHVLILNTLSHVPRTFSRAIRPRTMRCSISTADSNLLRL